MSVPTEAASPISPSLYGIRQRTASLCSIISGFTGRAKADSSRFAWHCWLRTAYARRQCSDFRQKRLWREWPVKQASFAFDILIARDSLLARLAEIKAPTLAMHGSDDKSYAPSYGRAIASDVGGNKDFVLIDKGEHFLSITNSEAVNAALKPFLEHSA
jgi:pimeloyl-ACP methyl ester carboxylesterase